MTDKKLLNYSDYLNLDKILNSQDLKSAENGHPAHDEMLFIIIHQVYELWFKQIIYELDSIINYFSSTSIDEKHISLSVSRLERIIEIQKIIVDLQSSRNISIILCDHQARDLLACVDVAMILSNGKIVAQDTPSNLVKDINAKNAYFGESFKFN